MSEVEPAFSRIERMIAQKITAIYLVVGFLWILLSGRLAQKLSGNNAKLLHDIEAGKGWFYVLATALLLYLLVRHFTREVHGYVAALNDSEAAQRRLAESRRHLLAELDHRVKNNLASLYSLITIYSSAARDKEDLAEVLRSKIMAMKLVHEMIAATGWSSIDLATLLNNIAAIHEPKMHGRTLALGGAALRLAPAQAGALGMIVQELLSNSIQHGAIHSPNGTLACRWRVLPPDPAASTKSDRIELTWSESGLAADADPPPNQRGVGPDLVRGMTEFDLGGEFKLKTSDGGLECTLRWPVVPVNHVPPT